MPSIWTPKPARKRSLIKPRASSPLPPVAAPALSPAQVTQIVREVVLADLRRGGALALASRLAFR